MDSSQDGTPEAGLPPVSPPSGKHILKLFLVPGLIVTAVVVFLIGAQWIFGTKYTAEKFLKDLNDSTYQVRWRAASDLSQVLKSDKELATNVELALGLTARLQASLDEAEKYEKQWQEELSKKGWDDADKTLRDRVFGERSYSQFLISSLGQFYIPVGVSALADIARTKEGVNEAIVQQRRYKAVISLGTLGERIPHFDQLPDEKQQQVLNALQIAAKSSDNKATWAQEALELFKKTKSGQLPESSQTLAAFELTASDDDPQLRHLSAWSLGFWKGDLAVELLISLINDDGHGEVPLDLAQERATQEKQGSTKDIDPRRIRTAEQYRRLIRYQALTGLASQGSERISAHLNLLKEMLNFEELKKQYTFRDKQGNEIVDSDLVITTIKSGLLAVRKIHKAQPQLISQEFRTAVELLTKNKNSTINTAASQTLAEM